MGQVLTMTGAPLLGASDLLQKLANRSDVAHAVVVVERTDGLLEVWYDRQSHMQIVFAAKVLDGFASDLASGALVDEDDE